jgi:hypothetical protein
MGGDGPDSVFRANTHCSVAAKSAAGSGDESASSADHERMQRRFRKRDKLAVVAVKAPTEMKTSEIEAAAWMGMTTGDPLVENLSDITRMYPHMLGGKTVTLSSLGTDGRVSTSKPVLDNEVPNPPISDILRAHIAKLDKPAFAMERDSGLSHSDLMSHLRGRRVVLPVFTAEFESQLLAEAGTHSVSMKSGHTVEFSFPPCCRGADCVGMTSRLPGFCEAVPGVVLMAMMTPEEFQVFMETSVPPRVSRSCILCHRAHVSSFILSLRPNYNRVNGVSSGFTCQLYRNLCDEPGGYYKVYTLHPNPTRYEGIFDAIVSFTRRQLFAFRDASQGGRWVIDQSSMVYLDPPLLHPNTGESLQDFRKRTNDYESVCSAQQPQRLSNCMALFHPVRLLVRVYGSYINHTFPLNYFGVPLVLQTSAQIQTTLVQLNAIILTGSLTLTKWAVTGPSIGFLASLVMDSMFTYRVVTPVDAAPVDMSSNLFTMDCLSQNMRPFALESCFWFQLRSGHIPPLVHLFNKATNQPCQKRKLSAMLKRFVRNNPIRRTVLRDLVLMVLLGSYPDTDPKHRLSQAWRDRLRWASIHDRSVLDELVVQCDELTLFALRRMLIQCVDDEPIFKKHVSLLCDWDAYADAVKQTLCQVRGNISKLPCEDLLIPEGFGARIGGIMATACRLAHPTVLNSCYKRQRPPLLTFLHTSKRGSSGNFDLRVTEPTSTMSAKQYGTIAAACVHRCIRRRYRQSSSKFRWCVTHAVGRFMYKECVAPVLRRILANGGAIPAGAVTPCPQLGFDFRTHRFLSWFDARSNDAFAQMIESAASLPFVPALDDCAVVRLEHALSGTSLKSVQDVCVFVREWIYSSRKATVDVGVLRCLQEWLDRLDVNTARLSVDVFPFLHHLGVPQAAITDMLDIVSEYDDYRLGQRQLTNRLSQFERMSPYSFYMMQIVCLMWLECGAVSVYELPRHYIDNQVIALRTKFDIPATSRYVMRNRLNFHYCSVCRIVYSIVRTPATAGTGKGRLLKSPLTTDGVVCASTKDRSRRHKHKDFSFGYNGAVLDYFTGLVYCKLDNRVAHRRCSAQPLQSVMLAGRVIVYDRQLVAMCPEPNCGLPFIYCGDTSVYTHRGYICHVCAAARHVLRIRSRMILPPLSSVSKKQSRCNICGTIVREKKTCFVYHRSMIVCMKHHSPALATYMKSYLLLSADATLRVMTKFLSQEKKNKDVLYAGINRARFNNNRRLARNGSKARRF